MNTISREIFEVEIVLLRTLRVKRNAGRGTPAKYLSAYWIILSLISTSQKWLVVFENREICHRANPSTGSEWHHPSPFLFQIQKKPVKTGFSVTPRGIEPLIPA